LIQNNSITCPKCGTLTEDVNSSEELVPNDVVLCDQNLNGAKNFAQPFTFVLSKAQVRKKQLSEIKQNLANKMLAARRSASQQRQTAITFFEAMEEAIRKAKKTM
jgi:hypothetical protein